MRRSLSVAAAAVALLTAGTSARADDPTWRLEQPPPPPGAQFKVSLGVPGDLKFWAPNRGLLATEGNAVVPRGLLYFNGQSWRQLSTVCGSTADSLRVAWAGPTEFWTVSEPSRPRLGAGTTLCHYRDGQVVASYGTAPQSPDPYRPMNAAACSAPNDCWFGGVAAEDPVRGRTGAFRLHFNGSELTTVYGPQGRGVTDLEFHKGVAYESVLVGPQPGDPTPAQLAEPEEDGPRLLHRFDGARWVSELFEPVETEDVPVDGTELLALDSDGAQMWAAGGGAASGPAAPQDSTVARPPIAARLGVPTFFEVGYDEAKTPFGPHDRFVDVAALPGTDAAWLAVQPFADRRSTNVKAMVARLDAVTHEITVQRLPAAGSGRGSAARIACPDANQCWLATSGGWLFHWTDGTPLPLDREPAFESLITFRPNEAAAQFVPDAPPVDDSQLLAPPPVEVAPPPVAQRPKVRRVRALLRNVRTKLEGTTLEVRFRLSRRARVALIARRRRTIVARTKTRTLRPGRHVLRLKLDRKRWPTRLQFSTRDLTVSDQQDAGSDDSVTTGDPASTAIGR